MWGFNYKCLFPHYQSTHLPDIFWMFWFCFGFYGHSFWCLDKQFFYRSVWILKMTYMFYLQNSFEKVLVGSGETNNDFILTWFHVERECKFTGCSSSFKLLLYICVLNIYF